jgi:hypothetical protein
MVWTAAGRQHNADSLRPGHAEQDGSYAPPDPVGSAHALVEWGFRLHTSLRVIISLSPSSLILTGRHDEARAVRRAGSEEAGMKASAPAMQAAATRSDLEKVIIEEKIQRKMRRDRFPRLENLAVGKAKMTLLLFPFSKGFFLL